MHATPKERSNWRLIGKGEGIHWDSLDEDISVEGLLAGRPSGETQASFKMWLAGRHWAQKPCSGPKQIPLVGVRGIRAGGIANVAADHRLGDTPVKRHQRDVAHLLL
jgi:Protein of unknown function (DUF2442)